LFARFLTPRAHGATNILQPHISILNLNLAEGGKLMQRFSILSAGLLAATLALPISSQAGNGAPSGAHYNLNIIGVSKGKTADMTGSNRHSIFVALGSKDGASVTSRIYLTQGPFAVCDGNAFDAAYDCNGTQIQSQGAVFQLPCNTNIPDDQDALVPCDGQGEEAAYEVYARALGTPGGSATITTCATLEGELVCSTENVVLVRRTGKSSFTNVTKELTSLVACEDLDPDPAVVDLFCTRYALFSGDFEDWHWQYDNKGLKLAQLRFYLLD
jgi:hypothetical protein